MRESSRAVHAEQLRPTAIFQGLKTGHARSGRGVAGLNPATPRPVLSLSRTDNSNGSLASPCAVARRQRRRDGNLPARRQLELLND